MLVGEKQKKWKLNCNGSNRVNLHERITCFIKITFSTIELEPYEDNLACLDIELNQQTKFVNNYSFIIINSFTY